MPPKGYPTTQFDMVVAEDAGLYKFDILSQRGLGKIKDAVELVHRNHPEAPRIDIHDVERFKHDEKVKTMLRAGKAIGCFYVESPAMRMLLTKLKVDHYLGLVAASSIIRPGVAKSGMMREYILRFRHPERREEAHPVMREIMPETFGVMVYQEDVIKVAHYFAGLTLGEADVLRRGMSGKYRGREEFQKVQEKFFTNCREKGYTDELSKEIWRQIESFAGYAFSKGHSASYAVESYQSLFLKAHYPLEYMCATINNFGGFYSTELYVHEARMNGADIQAPCVNRSNYLTTLEGNRLYLGFIHLHEFEIRAAEKLVKARAAKGAFVDFDDFIDRVAMGIEQVSILIRVGAFRFTGVNKRELLWQAHMKLGKGTAEPVTEKLFSVSHKNYTLPELTTTATEEAFDQMELLGFPLCNPFDLLESTPEQFILASDLAAHLNRHITLYGYLVTAKVTKTSNGKRMHFGNFLDYNGYFFDTVHFPQVAERFPFRGRGVYIVSGKVSEEFGCYSIEVTRMEKAALIPDPRYSDLRTTSKFRSLKSVEEGVLKRSEEKKKEVVHGYTEKRKSEHI
jgi:DNA polymerase-3 subunit alpha